jgi:hypothetical protein
MLKLTGLYSIADANLAATVGRMQLLRDVDLSACSRLGPETIAAVAKLSCLAALTLNNVPLLSDEDLAPIETLPLETLSICGLVLITDAFVTR